MSDELRQSLTQAFQYLDAAGVPIPEDIRIEARMKGVMGKAASDMASINAAYRDAITSALLGYFEGGGSVTGPRNKFRQAATDAFYDAFYLGWSDGGQKPPPDKDALDWLTARLNQEYGFIDLLMEQAKALRKEDSFDYFSWINQRADGYVQSVISAYNAGALSAKGRKMLIWHLGKTEKHCDTCLELNGKRHRAEWYISHNYIPRQAGAAMDCGGWNCDCRLTDDEGKEITL